uniref:Tha4 protein n=1 Tax=Solanum tuberosum TaxID=4113 RepID=M1BPS0_SOLTU
MAAIISSGAAVTTLSLTFTPKPISSSSSSSSSPSLFVSTPKIQTLCSSSSLFFNSNSQLFLGPPRTTRKVRSNSKRGLSCYCLFGLGVPELAVIAGVAALVFGPKQLPEVGRTIGKTVKSFQQGDGWSIKIWNQLSIHLKDLVGWVMNLAFHLSEGVCKIRAAKEFETELRKEPDASAQPPVEKAIEGSQEEKQDTKVSSTKESS